MGVQELDSVIVPESEIDHENIMHGLFMILGLLHCLQIELESLYLQTWLESAHTLKSINWL